MQIVNLLGYLLQWTNWIGNSLLTEWKHSDPSVCLLFRRERELLQRSIEAKSRNLQTMESSRSNRLRRFGEHMPALLTAIQEAHKKGQFKHRPRGPLGKTWCPVLRRWKDVLHPDLDSCLSLTNTKKDALCLWWNAQSKRTLYLAVW